MPQFNVDAARKSGYSDDEILGHLTQTRKFDVQGATKSGYSKQDIIGHLSGTPAPTAEPAKQEQPGFLERAAEPFVGIGDAVKQVWQKGAPRVVDEIGTAVKDRYVQNPQKTNNPLARGADAVFGPMVDQAGEDLRGGNYAGFAGTVAGNALLMGIPAIARRVSASKVPTVAAKAPSASQRAAGYAESIGQKATVGEKTGSRVLQGAERTAEYFPGASGPSTEFYGQRNQAILKKGKSIVQRGDDALNKAAGYAADRDSAATLIEDRISGRAADLKKYTNKKYDSVYQSLDRDTAARNLAQDVKYKADKLSVEKANRLDAEYWQTRKQLLYESGGNPDLITSSPQRPLPQKPAPAISAPVEMGPVKDKLRPLFEELKHTYTDTQKASSPGYARLKNIMANKDKIRSAIDIDKDLSEMKGVLRREQGKGRAGTKSGRYASASINALEKEMQAAIGKAGGEKAVQSLYQARKAVQEMHSSFEALDDLLPKDSGGSARLFDRIVERGDNRLDQIQEIRKRAPVALRKLGETYIEEVINKATGEGGSMDLSKSTTAWSKMGPKAKVEIYGAKAAGELDTFFENAPVLIKDMNKSGSGKFLMAQKVLNSGGLLVGALLGAGAGGAMEGLAVASGTMVGANLMAKFLFNPGNAKLVENTLRFAKKPALSKIYLKRLSAAVEAQPELLAALQTTPTAQRALATTEAK